MPLLARADNDKWVGSSRPVYLRADNGSQWEQEKVLVQAESRETRKAAPTKVQANVFQQASCLHRVHGTHRGQRARDLSGALYPAPYFLIPHSFKIASTTWYGPQLCRKDESGSPDPTSNPYPRARPRVLHAPSLPWV